MSKGDIGERGMGVGDRRRHPYISNKANGLCLCHVLFQRVCMKVKMANLEDAILFFQHKLESYKSSCNKLSSRHHPNPRQPAASLTSPFPCSPTTPIPLHEITHYSSITAPTSLDRQSSTRRFRRSSPT